MSTKKKGRFDHITVDIHDDVRTLTRFICLEDTSTRTTAKSATNDAPDVVDWINEHRREYEHGYKVHFLYKDTDGIVDGLKTDENGRFKGFKLLNCKSFKDAMKLLLI